MKNYLPLLFLCFCFFNCGRDNSKTDEIPTKKETKCDWCKSGLPDNAFCYYDEVRFSSRTSSGLYELDSIYLDRSPLQNYYVNSNNKKNWIEQHPFKPIKYSRTTLLLNTTSGFKGEGPLKPDAFLLQPFPSYNFCSMKCIQSFNKNVKFSKPSNSKFKFIIKDK